jgi:hypothetical protein
MATGRNTQSQARLPEGKPPASADPSPRNGLEPDRMTAAERLQEIGELFAAAILRRRARSVVQ